MQKNSACMQAKESRTRAIPQKEVWLRFFCVTQLIKEKHLFCCLVHNKYKTKQYLRNRLPQKNLTARENSSVLCTLSIKISWQTSLWPHQIESSFGTCANAFFQRPMVQNACHRMIPRREPFRHHGGTRWCHRALTLPRCRRSLKCIFSSPDDSGPIFSLANGSVDVPKRLSLNTMHSMVACFNISLPTLKTRASFHDGLNVFFLVEVFFFFSFLLIYVSDTFTSGSAETVKKKLYFYEKMTFLSWSSTVCVWREVPMQELKFQ